MSIVEFIELCYDYTFRINYWYRIRHIQCNNILETMQHPSKLRSIIHFTRNLANNKFSKYWFGIGKNFIIPLYFVHLILSSIIVPFLILILSIYFLFFNYNIIINDTTLQAGIILTGIYCSIVIFLFYLFFNKVFKIYQKIWSISWFWRYDEFVAATIGGTSPVSFKIIYLGAFYCIDFIIAETEILSQKHLHFTHYQLVTVLNVLYLHKYKCMMLKQFFDKDIFDEIISYLICNVDYYDGEHDEQKNNTYIKSFIEFEYFNFYKKKAKETDADEKKKDSINLIEYKDKWWKCECNTRSPQCMRKLAENFGYVNFVKQRIESDNCGDDIAKTLEDFCC